MSHCPGCRASFCEKCLALHYRDPHAICFGTVDWSQLAWSEGILAEQLAQPGDPTSDNMAAAKQARLTINNEFLKSDVFTRHPIELADALDLPACRFENL